MSRKRRAASELSSDDMDDETFEKKAAQRILVILGARRQFATYARVDVISEILAELRLSYWYANEREVLPLVDRAARYSAPDQSNLDVILAAAQDQSAAFPWLHILGKQLNDITVSVPFTPLPSTDAMATNLYIFPVIGDLKTHLSIVNGFKVGRSGSFSATVTLKSGLLRVTEDELMAADTGLPTDHLIALGEHHARLLRSLAVLTLRKFDDTSGSQCFRDNLVKLFGVLKDPANFNQDWPVIQLEGLDQVPSFFLDKVAKLFNTRSLNYRQPILFPLVGSDGSIALVCYGLDMKSRISDTMHAPPRGRTQESMLRTQLFNTLLHQAHYFDLNLSADFYNDRYYWLTGRDLATTTNVNQASQPISSAPSASTLFGSLSQSKPSDEQSKPSSTPVYLSQQREALHLLSKVVEKALLPNSTGADLGWLTDRYDDVSFCFVTPSSISLRQQTQGRIDLYEAGTFKAKQVMHTIMASSGEGTIEDFEDFAVQIEEVKGTGKSTLFVVLHDECHWGLTPTGTLAMHLHDGILNMNYDNVLHLCISATPENLFVAEDLNDSNIVQWNVNNDVYLSKMLKENFPNENLAHYCGERAVRQVNRLPAVQRDLPLQVCCDDNIGTTVQLLKITSEVLDLSVNTSGPGSQKGRISLYDNFAVMLDYLASFSDVHEVLRTLPSNGSSSFAEAASGFRSHPFYHPRFVQLFGSATTCQVLQSLSWRQKADSELWTGQMAVVRLTSSDLAIEFVERFKELRDLLDMTAQLCFLHHTGSESLSIKVEEPFLKLIKNWRSDRSFKPESFEHISRLPCVMVLVDRGRMGDTFPENLAAFDLRACYSQRVIRSTFIQDAGRSFRYNSYSADTGCIKLLLAQRAFDALMTGQYDGYDDRIKQRPEAIGDEIDVDGDPNQAENWSVALFQQKWTASKNSLVSDPVFKNIHAIARMVLFCAAPQIGKTSAVLKFSELLALLCKPRSKDEGTVIQICFINEVHSVVVGRTKKRTCAASGSDVYIHDNDGDHEIVRWQKTQLGDVSYLPYVESIFKALSPSESKEGRAEVVQQKVRQACRKQQPFLLVADLYVDWVPPEFRPEMVAIMAGVTLKDRSCRDGMENDMSRIFSFSLNSDKAWQALLSSPIMHAFGLVHVYVGDAVGKIRAEFDKANECVLSEYFVSVACENTSVPPRSSSTTTSCSSSSEASDIEDQPLFRQARSELSSAGQVQQQHMNNAPGHDALLNNQQIRVPAPRQDLEQPPESQSEQVPSALANSQRLPGSIQQAPVPSAEPIAKRGRGRPRTVREQVPSAEPIAKRGRGRPRKVRK